MSTASTMNTDSRSESRQFCTFLLGENRMGLDVLCVQEVVRTLRLTPVPLAHPAVRGLMNLRGQIVTAIDLRTRLDLPQPAGEIPPISIVVQTGDGPVSLLVDEIGDVVEVTEDQLEPPPDTLSSRNRELILGAYKLPEKLLVILDHERVVTLPAAST